MKNQITSPPRLSALWVLPLLLLAACGGSSDGGQDDQPVEEQESRWDQFDWDSADWS